MFLKVQLTMLHKVQENSTGSDVNSSQILSP
jgi:hypothetical protein